MKFKKVNHEDYIYLLIRRLVLVADRDNLPSLPSEIMTSLDNGSAHLFVGERCGAVIHPVVEDGRKCMYVSFGWSDTGSAIDDYSKAYEILARSIGAERIVTVSRRLGVLRLWRKHGFKKVGYNEQGLIKIEKVIEVVTDE
ncbi:hypothetical protein P7M25_09690 [Vibrio parahaemolyticus]|nr:hypothetical protein [Vibrio parahaemolyticus]